MLVSFTFDKISLGSAQIKYTKSVQKWFDNHSCWTKFNDCHEPNQNRIPLCSDFFWSNLLFINYLLANQSDIPNKEAGFKNKFIFWAADNLKKKQKRWNQNKPSITCSILKTKHVLHKNHTHSFKILLKTSSRLN